MKPVDAVRRWWRDRHPAEPIEHREPPAARDKGGPVEHGPTKAPFSRAHRRAAARQASRMRSRTGQHPTYQARR